MNTLQVSLFGNIRIAHAYWTADVNITRVAKALLAYLLLHRHRIHHRDVLAGLFWGDYDEERARSCLSTALWRLRRALEPKQISKGTYLVTTPAGEIGFNNDSDYWLDVEIFEQKVRQAVRKPVQAMRSGDISHLENALELYIGELLEGFYYDWALRERERLSLQYLKSLEHLMDYHGYHKAYDQAITCGQRILYHDPLREEIHREMMRLYAQSGQRTLAIRHYENCCQILKAELGIDPMEETRALYNKIAELTDSQIAGAALRISQDVKIHAKATGLDEAFHKLHSALEDCEKIRSKLLQVTQLLERIKKRPPR